MKKRVLALLLAVFMLVSLLPTSALATEGDPGVEMSDPVDPGVVKSGDCGGGVTWTVYDNGLLTLEKTGEGDGVATFASWQMHVANGLVTEVEVREGVTKFETSSPNFGSALTSPAARVKKATIAASVTDLGHSAFMNCKELETVIFAEGSQLTKIDGNAFFGCERLRSRSRRP